MVEWQKFRKKPIVIEAYAWNGVHDENVTRYLRGSFADGRNYCEKCGKPTETHGLVHTLEGRHIACPTDFIIRGIRNELYPCKKDIFEATYEVVQG